MRNLINRLDAICHPFPGIHVLGVVSSVIFVTVLVVWPTTGETGSNTDQAMPIPALSLFTEAMTKPAAQAPRLEIRSERVNQGDSLSRLFNRQGLSPTLLHALTQAEDSDNRVSKLNVGQ
ncbi:MAG TPA: peptidase M23, partial [Gammaproteobacteria bacterium]|nr:peptidase M23 [Gammaproteobacteria bacterium]